MNVYDKMVMGPTAGNQEGAAERKWFKHMGELELEGSNTAVVILFRTVPDEPKNALVVGPKFLSDSYHNALMRALESEGGQAENELGSYLARQTFPDGVNMLALLQQDNYIKKFDTKSIIVTYGPLEDGRIALDKLNELIAKEQGVKVSELAIKDDSAKTSTKKATTTKTKTKAKATTTKKADAKETTKK